MNKFSFKIGDIGITPEQHNKYKNLIEKILSELYPDRIFIYNIPYVKAQKFDTEGSYVSILNKAIGNITLFKWLFKLNKSFDKLISFVKNNKISLFKNKEIYFDNMLTILKISEEKGIKNENTALKYIESYLNSKNINSLIKRTPLLSLEDVMEGIDIVITINNKDWYVQVKPLKYFYKKGDNYEIISSGKIKKYNNIHYYIFVNSEECLLFSNTNLKVKNGIVYVPINDIKN